MSDFDDLLDAIARVRGATGDDGAWMTGLSADDIAAAASPVSSPAAVSAALAKLRAAHPDIFASGPGPGSGPPVQTTDRSEGAAAEAIRTAETALAQQNSLAAQVDMQVVTAVLNAHANHAASTDALMRLQNEIEAAVATRTDLDTAVGARGFQRYLIDKLRDIRTVVETADLDATSKASLAAALASLYATSASASADPGPTAAPAPQSVPDTPPPAPHPRSPAPPLPPLPPSPVELGLDPPRPTPDSTAVSPPGYPSAATAPSAGALPPAGAGWGGGLPATGMPFGGGLPALPGSAWSDPAPDPLTDPPPHDVGSDHGAGHDDPPGDRLAPGDPASVVLPDGHTVVAPSPQLAAVITAAIGGTPIAEAFSAQGMAIPEPGTAVTAPVDATRVLPGDIALFTDRHALALGAGKALLDNQIQSIADVSGLGFLGWQHPPEPPGQNAQRQE